MGLGYEEIVSETGRYQVPDKRRYRRSGFRAKKHLSGNPTYQDLEQKTYCPPVEAESILLVAHTLRFLESVRPLSPYTEGD